MLKFVQGKHKHSHSMHVFNCVNNARYVEYSATSSTDTPPAIPVTGPHQKVLYCCGARMALAQQLKVLLLMTQGAASFLYLLCCLLDLHHCIMSLHNFL